MEYKKLSKIDQIIKRIDALSMDEHALLVKKLVRRTEKIITIPMIIKEVCEYYDVAPEKITIGKTTHDMAILRHRIMYLAYKLTGKSRNQIGEYFNKLNLATIFVGINRIEKELDKNIDLKNDMIIIEFKLSQQ